MEPIISAKNLNFTYNKSKDNEFQALININLDIYPDEFVIVFGPSGCGKSTLLNVFAGLEQPDTGSVYAFEKDLLEMNPGEVSNYHRRQVGMIYQAYNLITSLTVLNNVALPQIFVNVRKRKREKWSMSLLERFGILEHAHKIPTELSGGEQQRIGIARAIVNNPQIVLADEPVGNLDSVSAKNVLDILEDLNEKEKKTIVLVTHNPEYLDYGDRIIYMKDGIITREIVNKEKHKKTNKQSSAPRTPTTEMADLMRAYRGLSPEQINILIMPYKAKVFAHHFITTRNMEETRVFEEIIQRRLLGTISQEELYDILNRAALDGGVGFDKRTADKILRRVNRIIRMAYFIYQKGRQRKDEQGTHIKITIDEKTKKLTDYLLRTCYHEYYKNLDEEQVRRLKQAVKDRILGNIHKVGFLTFLDQSFSDGGVGLNSKTAQAVTEEIELILILGFGIIEMVYQRTLLKQQGEDADSNKESNSNKGQTKDLIDAMNRPEVEIRGNEERKDTVASDSSHENKRNDAPTEDEIKEVVRGMVDKIDDVGMKDFANITGKVIQHFGGVVDGKQVGEVVKEGILSRSHAPASSEKKE